MDGEDKEPLTSMACAHRFRAKKHRLHFVTSCAKLSVDHVESELEVIPDVLEEEDRGFGFLDSDSPDVGPEVSGVLLSEFLPADAEGLAGISRNEDIHRSAATSAVECASVAPDRRRRKETRLHKRDQNDGSESFPLHVTDCASRSNGEVDSKIKAARSGAERQDSGT